MATKQQLIDEIKALGFASYEHAAMMVIKGKAVKMGQGFAWLQETLMALTYTELEIMRKYISNSTQRWH